MYDIMIVDDCEILRSKIRHLPIWKKFSEFQISAEAQNGTEALERLEKQPFQIVMTDIRMPLMDGLELLKNIQNSHLADCVILLCEDANFEYAHQGMILGAFDYMVKPVKEKYLESVLNRILKYLGSKKKDRDWKKEKEIVRSFIQDEEAVWSEKIEQLIEEKELADERETGDYLRALYGEILEEVERKKPWISQITIRKNQTNGIQRQEQIQKEVFETEIKQMRTNIAMFTYTGKNEMIEKVCSFILNHPKEKCCLSEISERFYVNKTYLSHQFKQELGIGLMNYMTKFKVECAKKMLAETQMESGEIARAIGYENTRYFGQIFHRQTGETMAQYRKNAVLF